MGDALAWAMVQFWDQSQKRFTVDQQPHYLYSPRELTRWKVAILEALMMEGGDNMSPSEMIRLYVHEGLRIFCDRLVFQEEKDWTNEQIDNIARYFVYIFLQKLLRIGPPFNYL